MRFLTLILMWLAAGVAVAQQNYPPVSTGDYYVCLDAAQCNDGASGWSSGSDSNNGTSKATPFRCPQAAINALKSDGAGAAGKTVVFGAGTYAYSQCSSSNGILRTGGSPGIRGTSGNHILLVSEQPLRAIMDGGETDISNNNRGVYLWQLDYSQYVTIRGFQFRQAKAATWMSGNALAAAAVHITFEDNKSENMGFSHITTSPTSHHWIVQRNTMGITMESYSYTAGHRCSHNHVMYMMGHSHVVQNNVMYQSDGGSTMSFGGWCAAEGSGTSDPAGYEFGYKFVNNTMVGDGCGLDHAIDYPNEDRYQTFDFWNRAFTSGNCSTNGRHFKDITIANNLFLMGNPGTSGSSGYRFHELGSNNAKYIYASPQCKHWPFQSGQDCTNNPANSGAATNLVVVNNISEDRYVLTPAYQGDADTYTDNAEESGNQNLVNETLRNYRPTVSSTAIVNQGNATYAPATDADGNPRVSTPDIGAYEYQSGVGTSPPPPGGFGGSYE